jgi:hypothetical protein
MRLAIYALAAVLLAFLLAVLLNIWAWPEWGQIAYTVATVGSLWVVLWKWGPK